MMGRLEDGVLRRRRSITLVRPSPEGATAVIALPVPPKGTSRRRARLMIIKEVNELEEGTGLVRTEGILTVEEDGTWDFGPASIGGFGFMDKETIRKVLDTGADLFSKAPATIHFVIELRWRDERLGPKLDGPL